MTKGKVIYSIERCICHVPDACRDCAYDAGHPYNECVEMLLKDVLELLKEQEPKSAIIEGSDVAHVGRCPSCHVILTPFRANYCYCCGKAVKWE